MRAFVIGATMVACLTGPLSAEDQTSHWALNSQAIAFSASLTKMPSALIAKDAVSLLAEFASRPRCTGDGCDAFLPVYNHVSRYPEAKGQMRLDTLLGGIAGAIIGEELLGAPGAIAVGAVGAYAGRNMKRDRAYEERILEYRAAWMRGDDISYNPAHRFPAEPHWLYAGPPRGDFGK